MSDNKKYYYFRMTENFFDSESMIVLESMQDGYLYSNILLKLYAKSLKGDGRLMFNNHIPYSATVLAQITRHQVGTVEKALQLFCNLGLIEVLDNGAIYILDIQNLIGKSSTEADRKRDYRLRIEAERGGVLALDAPEQDKRKKKNPPEKELELEREGTNAPTRTQKDTLHKRGDYGWVRLSDKEYNRLLCEFGEETAMFYVNLIDERAQQTGNKNKWKDWNLTIRRAIREKWGGEPPPERKWNLLE